jgi:VWFA-related protein
MSIQCLVAAAVAVSLAAWQDHRPRTETQLFRVTAERIQFDALFLDGLNRPVPDIRLDEVTVKQAGVVVPLSDLRFRSHVSAPRTRSVDATRESPPPAPASGATALAPDETDAWVFLIDDLAISPDGFARAKSGLLAMIARDLPSGAAVGILRTGVLGTHQTRLTDDRAELVRSITGMQHRSNRWRGGLMSRSGATVAGPNSKDQVFVEGTLGSLNSLLLSLRPLSGRKVVVLMSEMIALTAEEADVHGGGWMPSVTWNVGYNGVAQRMRRLGRLASEAGVTVHTVDLAGVINVASRERALQDEGLHAVADELGGIYVGRSNDVRALLEGVRAVEQGHYVLAYEPPTGTFDDGGTARFVDVAVTVSRPGVTVKTRKGFFTR